MKVDDKVVVVTGGASGIGFSIVENFLKKKPKVVVILDFDDALGEEALKKLSSDKVIFLHLDVCDSKRVDEVIDEIINKYQTIDVLVNSAGISDEIDPKKTIEVNLGALVEISIKVWHKIRKNAGGNGGTIINIASVYGYKVNGFFPSYIASKHGVIGFTKSLGHQYNFDKSGVRVVALCPGWTITGIAGKAKLFCSEEYGSDLTEYIGLSPWQESEAVGKAALEIYEQAESGSAWIVEGGKPIAKVCSTYSHCYDNFKRQDMFVSHL